MKPWWTSTRMMERENYGKGEKQLLIQSIKHHLSTCMAASGPRSLVFIDEVTADRRSNELWSGQGYALCSYSAKYCKTQCFTAQVDIQSKQQRQPKSFSKQRNVIVTWSQPNKAAFQLLKTNLKAERPIKKQLWPGGASHVRKHSIWWCSHRLHFLPKY